MECCYLVALLFFAALFLSILLTFLVRDYALTHKILDIPNERSSHTHVTPRGGGLGFVIIIILGLGVLFFQPIIEINIAITLIGGGFIVAIIGWWDDKNGLSPRIRSVFHFIAAVWALYWLGGFSNLDIGFMTVPLGSIGTIIAVIGIVWMINLYNFMDGIDGIAGTEAVSVLIIAGILVYMSGNMELACLCGFLAVSVAGFLVWNWPPARIFMGDVGSGFLGFVFACLAIFSENAGAVPLIIWILLLGVFVIDATSTLIMRLCQGKKWYEAHRSHVYQLAVQVGFSHKQVTLTVLVINCGLGLIAYWIFMVRDLLLPVSLITAVLLIFLSIYLRKRFMIKIERLSIKPNHEVKRGLVEAAAHNDKE